MEEQTGFSSQTWFYCGLGNELDLKLIEKHWNEGRRITSAAYTSNGWFVTMAKNSGLTWQACHYDSNWRTDWLAEHRKNNRYITSIGMSANKWFIVVSEGTGYTDQINNCGDWDQMSQWIKKYWNEDFRITHAARHTSGWDIVMSKNSGIDQQTYCFATESEFKKQTGRAVGKRILSSINRIRQWTVLYNWLYLQKRESSHAILQHFTRRSRNLYLGRMGQSEKYCLHTKEVVLTFPPQTRAQTNN